MTINSPYGMAFAEDTGLALGDDVDPTWFEESIEKTCFQLRIFKVVYTS